mgnify:CR=1 FL=1
MLLPAQPITLFPGDANNDGRADQYDLLPIGVAFGQEGFPRPGASLAWLPQLQPQQWPQNLPLSGVNLAFCDSDGNGFIDEMDIDAIALNFDSTQAEALPPPGPYLLPDTCFSCPAPELLITFDRDTALINDTFYATLSIRFPEGLSPSLGVLGIAFALTYDTDNIRDSLTMVFPDTMPGDLLFVTATHTLAQAWRALPPGNIGFGAAGKGMNALYFTRELGKVELVVEDMIIRSTATDFWMDAAGFLLLNANEQAISFGGVVADTIVLFDPLNGVREARVRQPGIRLFPNPASERLTVHSPDAPLLRIGLCAASGQRLPLGWSGHSDMAEVDLNHLPAGFYWVEITTAAGTTVRKLNRTGAFR